MIELSKDNVFPEETSGDLLRFEGLDLRNANESFQESSEICYTSNELVEENNPYSYSNLKLY